MNLVTVLQYLRPGSSWSLNGDTYEGLVWLSPGEPPTQLECEQAWPAAQTAELNRIAKNNRHQAFTAEADPLFFAWQRGEGTEQAWLDKVAEIRARYPYA